MGIWPIVGFKKWHKDARGGKQAEANYPENIHQMLDGMSVELAEKVHLLFMANYIDYSDYDFRDDGQVENDCWCYRDLFELKTKESQEIVNSQLIEFLDEWRQDAPSLYQKAKDDICYWITDEWYSFRWRCRRDTYGRFCYNRLPTQCQCRSSSRVYGCCWH